ncbi:DMT family transporter [Leifsonia aquatica]|uniref:DMT family transporter n=1 Tax=Leifsonia aquatica TaxID=144185 RepID=UPI00384CBB66
MRSRTDAVAGLFWAVVATALWGATFLGPAAVEPVGPAYLVFGRYLFFGLLSLVVLIVHRRRAVEIGMRKALLALHLGIVGYVGFYLFFSFSAAIGGGALASIITGVMPAVVTIASNLITKQVRWRRLAAPIAITAVGLLVINLRTPAALSDITTSDLITTTALALVACALWSYFVVANGIVLRRTDRPAIDNTTWTALIGVGALIGSLGLLPIAWTMDATSPIGDESTLVRFLIVSVLLATLGSWCASWSWNRATGRISTLLLGQLMALETLFGALFNLLWESRWPTLQEIIGAALVTTGVIVCARTLERHRAKRAGAVELSSSDAPLQEPASPS